MLSETRVYQLLGFLFLLFLVEASLLDNIFGNIFEDNTVNQTLEGQVQVNTLEGEVEGQALEVEGPALDVEVEDQVLEGEGEGQAMDVEGQALEERFGGWWRASTEPPLPITEPTTPEPPIIKDHTCVKIEAVVKTEVMEENINEVKIVPYTIGETTFITITEKAIIPTTLFTRSTTIVPPWPITKTQTHLVYEDSVIDGVGITTQDVLIFETQLVVSTHTLTSTLTTTVVSESIIFQTRESETTQTVYKPYTVTTTRMTTYTEKVSIPIQLIKEHSVNIPVVTVVTRTTRIPHIKSVTDWVTSITTTTMCTNLPLQPQPPRQPPRW